MVSNSDNDGTAIGCFGGFKLLRFPKRKQETSPATKVPSVSNYKNEKARCTSSHNLDFYAPSEWGVPTNNKQSVSDCVLPPYTAQNTTVQDPAEKTINEILNELDPELYQLSTKIHDHPEIGFEERFARDTLTAFMQHHGFNVTSGYLGLETAWKAEYSHGTDGKVIGINSEMDALSGIGHACGHNLIAASGCGIAVALKAALETHGIPGKIILLGTPAEEAEGEKSSSSSEVDTTRWISVSHPGPGPQRTFDLGTTIAIQTFEVEYLGKSAHAGAAPWEGVNALDAAFLAYSSLSVLRQQMQPTQRSHGIVEGRDWISNVIPDNARLRWQVRASTYEELSTLTERVLKCFQAAALATGCTVKIDQEPPYYELKQNPVLAKVFTNVVQTHFGHSVTQQGSSASTDFGNVGFYLPALHPMYSIPTKPNGGNHTPAFTKASATKEAHAANMITTRSLALTSLQILQNEYLFQGMKAAFASGL
ncbi:hypothetical protein BDP27DRAFT_1446243 [Rhodocollybia butyracea]|uniref:Peptidase M20 dimerisation domain-containing protein n=1 Tax=Rhodocollybia butyracea TaxID=206335 RepID=A0A9P5PYD4_9AGAR|nr:hypothetical protein BDP27DRAFT_1446243 [Rhodocollybia butyracea]